VLMLGLVFALLSFAGDKMTIPNLTTIFVFEPYLCMTSSFLVFFMVDIFV